MPTLSDHARTLLGEGEVDSEGEAKALTYLSMVLAKGIAVGTITPEQADELILFGARILAKDN